MKSYLDGGNGVTVWIKGVKRTLWSEHLAQLLPLWTPSIGRPWQRCLRACCLFWVGDWHTKVMQFTFFSSHSYLWRLLSDAAGKPLAPHVPGHSGRVDRHWADDAAWMLSLPKERRQLHVTLQFPCFLPLPLKWKVTLVPWHNLKDTWCFQIRLLDPDMKQI